LTPAGPPPVRVGKRLVVPADFSALKVSLTFDVPARAATARAVAEVGVAGHEGYPAFDLRQVVGRAWWDGVPLAAESLGHEDVGPGPEARMRVLDKLCSPGRQHELVLEYELAAPDAAGALPVGWAEGGDGVSWDLWMSDLEPGRYLEMWAPCGLCHDQLSIELDVEVVGAPLPHRLLANGEVTTVRPGARWRVRYPAHYTSLSPLLVLAPEDQLAIDHSVVEAGGRAISLTVAAYPGAVADLGAVKAGAERWLASFSRRYGRWVHDDRFLAVMWASTRGMEYDGATTASEAALEHEIFHSWFGRGVKPASANDGWMDEAMATWATASARSAGARFAAEPLGLDEPPALLCPAHPWGRHTPRQAYGAGSRLVSGLAAMAGGAAVMRDALAAWHQAYGGRLASTADLARHLSSWCGRDLGPWWDRYVYGGESLSGA
jgi:hypothetical protein